MGFYSAIDPWRVRVRWVGSREDNELFLLGAGAGQSAQYRSVERRIFMDMKSHATGSVAKIGSGMDTGMAGGHNVGHRRCSLESSLGWT